MRLPITPCKVAEVTKGTRKARCPSQFPRTLGKKGCIRSSSAFFAFLRCL